MQAGSPGYRANRQDKRLYQDRSSFIWRSLLIDMKQEIYMWVVVHFLDAARRSVRPAQSAKARLAGRENRFQKMTGRDQSTF